MLAFHRESLVFDLHIDTLLWQRFLGYDPLERHEPLLPAAAYAWQMDLPRAAEAGLDGAVLAIVVTPREVLPEQPLELRIQGLLERGGGLAQTLATLDLLANTATAHPERLTFARSGGELRAAVAAGRFAALAGLEGAHGLEDRIENARTAHARGLRMLGLVHFQRSGAAFPMTVPEFDGETLTRFGFDLLAELDALPMLADLAHLNAPGFDAALATLRRPCVVSHSACRALTDQRRNLDDVQIRRLADAGGVIGIAAGRSFVGAGGLDAFVAHVEHAARVGGVEHVAIGSDWDGAIVPAPGLEDVRGLPFVTERLLTRGWRTDDVRRFLGGNALRVISDALG